MIFSIAPQSKVQQIIYIVYVLSIGKEIKLDLSV